MIGESQRANPLEKCMIKKANRFVLLSESDARGGGHEELLLAEGTLDNGLRGHFFYWATLTVQVPYKGLKLHATGRRGCPGHKGEHARLSFNRRKRPAHAKLVQTNQSFMAFFVFNQNLTK